ncbi:cytochrome c-type biogenesis protein CcmH [Ectothiorhodospiraceae bacterium WFHF3C12]|nr:cytochrome c-type biogenesis protein CcmH [Ectothiorhodospiraceae bacterium WFHF3C12]
MIRALLLALMLLGTAMPVAALTMDSYEFESEAERERFRELLAELRCLVCQNESLADSQADLAGDLREQVYEQMQQGKTNGEITEYLVARYGDFVRYRPPVTPGTYLLWFGPPVILLLGLFFAVRLLRGRTGQEQQLNEAQRRRAAELLDEDDRGDGH